MAKEKKNKLTKIEKTATVIDGKDYWNVEWYKDNTSGTYDSEKSQHRIHVQTKGEIKSEKAKRADALSWTFFTIVVVLLCTLGEFIIVNIADAIWHSQDAEQLLGLISAIPLFFGAAAPVADFTDYLEREKDFFKSAVGNVDETFTVEEITHDQASDIVNELKRFQRECNVYSYMEIVKKLYESQKELESKAEKEYNKKLARSKATDAEKLAIRSKTNPFLNSVEVSNHSLELFKEVKKLTDEEKVLDTQSLVKTLKDLDKNRENGVTYDKKSYDDCSRELLQVTRKYNETLDSGIKLSNDELKNYQSLVDACSVVLKRVSEGAIEERSIDARVSDIFIRDKYGISNVKN